MENLFVVQLLTLNLLLFIIVYFFINRKDNLSSYERGFNDGQLHKVENLRSLVSKEV